MAGPNFELRDDTLLICDGEHDRSAPCDWRPATPEDVTRHRDSLTASGIATPPINLSTAVAEAVDALVDLSKSE
jgi:hypothetical protein